MAEMSLNQNLNCIEISNSGKLAAIGNEFGEIIIFKLPEFEYIGRSIGHSKELSCLKWSPDDKQIISLSSDNSVCIWNIYRTLYEYQ
jgi:WD40 repeat protein